MYTFPPVFFNLQSTAKPCCCLLTVQKQKQHADVAKAQPACTPITPPSVPVKPKLRKVQIEALAQAMPSLPQHLIHWPVTSISLVLGTWQWKNYGGMEHISSVIYPWNTIITTDTKLHEFKSACESAFPFFLSYITYTVQNGAQRFLSLRKSIIYSLVTYVCARKLLY